MKEWKGQCHRCYRETGGYTMSFLNTQLICFECDETERNHPRYREAKEAELKELKAGNRNYKGLLG